MKINPFLIVSLVLILIGGYLVGSQLFAVSGIHGFTVSTTATVKSVNASAVVFSVNAHTDQIALSGFDPFGSSSAKLRVDLGNVAQKCVGQSGGYHCEPTTMTELLSDPSVTRASYGYPFIGDSPNYVTTLSFNSKSPWVCKDQMYMTADHMTYWGTDCKIETTVTVPLKDYKEASCGNTANNRPDTCTQSLKTIYLDDSVKIIMTAYGYDTYTDNIVQDSFTVNIPATVQMQENNSTGSSNTTSLQNEVTVTPTTQEIGGKDTGMMIIGVALIIAGLLVFVKKGGWKL